MINRMIIIILQQCLLAFRGELRTDRPKLKEYKIGSPVLNSLSKRTTTIE